jgi:putative oxidoreductase
MIVNFLVALFMTAIAINMFRGLDIQCGCFSTSGEASGKMAGYLIRDGFLLLIGIWIYYYRLRQEKRVLLSLI